MRSVGRSLHVARTLLWQQYRAQGLRLIATSVGFGVLYFGLNLVTLRWPGVLTGPTYQALQQFVRLYVDDVNGATSLALALLIVQGPYTLSLFGVLTALRVGRQVTRNEIESGRFKLLLATPYEPQEVFRGLIFASLLIASLQMVLLAAIGLGGSILLLVLQGVTIDIQLSPIVYISFLTPFPAVLWAVIVTVVVSLFVEDVDEIGGPENLINYLGIAPPLAALLLLTFKPGVSLVLVAVATLGLCTLGTLAGSVAIERWFDVSKVLT